MLFISNPDYELDLGSILEKSSTYVSSKDFNMSSKNVLFRQLFYDYWLSDKYLPTFKTSNALINVLTYFHYRINSLKESTDYDVIRKNTIYRNFAKEIMFHISNKLMTENQLDLLIDVFCDEVFFMNFIEVFRENIEDQYEGKLLALSNIFQKAFDEKDVIMLQFKNRFIDQLLEKYKYGLKFEENSEKRNNILLNVEEILKKYLEIFKDKKEKNYIEIQKYILQFFFDNGVDLFKKEVKVNENKEKIKNHKEQMEVVDEKVQITIEEDNIEKTIIGKKTNRIKEQNKVTKKKSPKKKGSKKQIDEEIEIQEEENKEEPDVEEEKDENEEKEEDKKDEEKPHRGKIRKVKNKQISGKKREKTKKSEEKTESSKKVLHHPKISKKIKAKPLKSTNITAVKSPKKETTPKKSYSSPSPKKVTPQKETPKKTTPKKERPKKQTPKKVTPEKRSTPLRQNTKSPRQLRSSSSKKQQNEPIVTNLKTIKIPSSPIQNLNIKPKSIIKRAKLDSPKGSLKSSGSKRGSSGNKKHFFEELEEKYNNQKKRSPSKFNVTPMKKKNSSTKTTVKEIKENQSSTKKQDLSSGKNKIKNEMLGKKRGISFSTDRYVKEFDPKTPVKEIKSRVIRKSPIERKNKVKKY